MMKSLCGRVQSLHVEQVTACCVRAGQMTTFRFFGVFVFVVWLGGSTVVTGATPRSQSASAWASELPLKFIVNPFRFTSAIAVLFGRWRERRSE